MNVEPYLQRIRQEFPSLHFKKVRVPCQGMDHVALILDERWVFRFPILKKYKQLFPREIPLLEELHRRLPLPIPHYELIAHDRSFGAYRMISGDSLQAKTYKRCSERSRRRMEKQMAKFLSVLHAIPLSFAKKHHVSTLHPRKVFEQRVREYRRHLLKTLTKKELKSVKAYFAETRRHLDDAYTPCLIHCDLYVDHIFIDARHAKIIGVIDFGDRAVFDPAIDFAGLWDYGQECVGQVYAQYTGPKDPTFLTRSWLRYKQGALGWLSVARHRKWKSEREAYAHFKKFFS